MQHEDSYIVVKEFTDNGKKTREVIATGVTKQGFIDAYTEKGCVMRGGENPHFEDIYSGIVYKLEKEFEQGGQIDRERDIQIAKTILMQMGGSNRLQMFTGAYNFVAVPYGVSFRIKNRKVNYVKIVLNAMDTYDVEFGLIRGTNYKIVKELSGIYNDQLVEVFTRYTGMVLRLRKGGAIQGEENAEMVMNQNLQIRHHTEELEEILKSGKEVPAWVVSKISRAADSMSDATHYLEGTPDKMARGGNPRLVDISKLKVYVLTYVPVFDINQAMQIKQKAVYAESEEDAISQLPRKAKVLSIQVSSGGGRGTPQQQGVRQSPLSQQIQNEIKALKEMLPLLEGKDKKQVQDAIENLEDTLDEMRAEGQYAEGGGVDEMARGGGLNRMMANKFQKASFYFKELENGMSQKQKKFFNALLKRRQPSFEKNFTDTEIANYINGEIEEQFGIDLGIKKYDITGQNWFKLGFKFIAYRESIEEPDFWEDNPIPQNMPNPEPEPEPDFNIEQVKGEIEALKELLPFLEGDDKKEIEEQIDILSIALKQNENFGGGAEKEQIKQWYRINYPDDDLGNELNDAVTFEDLWNGLHNGTDVYEIIGVGDSDIRKDLFWRLSEIYGVDYNYVYLKWLDSDEPDAPMLVPTPIPRYAKGGGVGNLRVGSQIGFLRPHTGRYEWADVLSIEGDKVNLVVRHPKRSQLDNYFSETIQRITKFTNTESDDWKDSRPIMKIKYANGGGVGTHIDLFEDYENMPPKIAKIFDKYSEDFEDGNYKGLSMALKEMQQLGYTFEYYLDGQAYGLRPIGVPLNQLKGYEDFEEDYAKGGEVGNFPPKGELKNKENLLLKYEKIGSDYEFFVYKPEKRDVSSYEQIKYVCVNKDCPTRMSYNQFLNYLYAETYLDDRKFANGGGVGELEKEIDAIYFKSGFINYNFNWRLKLLEMLQDQSIEAYNIYQKLTDKQKDDVLQEQFEMDNDMGSDGDGEMETSFENLNILLQDASNGKIYAKGGEVFVCPVGTQIQSLIFDKSMFNLRQAKAWAKKNKFENDFVDGKLNTLRIRQKDPAMFTEDGFRTIQLRQGVQAVIGCPKRKISRKK